MHVLMVLTSHDQLGNTGRKTGFWLEEGLTKVAPFLVEDEMMNLGAAFSKVKNWGVHTVADGRLLWRRNAAVVLL